MDKTDDRREPKEAKMMLGKAFCPRCDGIGKVEGKQCKKCLGTGYVVQDRVNHTEVTDKVSILDEDDGYCD